MDAPETKAYVAKRWVRDRAAARRAFWKAAAEHAAVKLSREAFRRLLGGVAAAPAGWSARAWRRSPPAAPMAR